jgi:glycosyltransferase involved in cell wall biosynthesis
MPVDGVPLRVAYLVYRGNPRCGGQGVYTRHLTRELAALGHQVTVFSGQPYPQLDEEVGFVAVPSLDLYRQPDPFRVPRLSEFHSTIDAAEFALMCTAGFPEPLTFSLRAHRLLAARRGDFDLVHDNQSLGSGLLSMMRDGWPLLATIHHPITVDRRLDLSHAHGLGRQLTLRRWYGFIRMQARVARRIPRVITVSESSRRDISSQLGVELSRLAVVPVGVDESVFRPHPEVRRLPGRLVTTASADVPMKGLVPLLEALAKVRTERDDAHLVVVGRLRDDSRIPGVLDRLGLQGSVRFVSGISDPELADLYASAEVAVVPSLYEGFSLPAIEAMASGLPLIATTGGALPEVAGTDGETALLVPPDDPGALAAMVLRALSNEELRDRIASAGRLRTLERFTWPVTARLTAEQYRVLLEEVGHDSGAEGGRADGHGAALVKEAGAGGRLRAGGHLLRPEEMFHLSSGAEC